MVILASNNVKFTDLIPSFSGSSQNINLSRYYKGGSYVTSIYESSIPTANNPISIGMLRGRSSNILVYPPASNIFITAGYSSCNLDYTTQAGIGWYTAVHYENLYINEFKFADKANLGFNIISKTTPIFDYTYSVSIYMYNQDTRKLIVSYDAYAPPKNNKLLEGYNWTSNVNIDNGYGTRAFLTWINGLVVNGCVAYISEIRYQRIRSTSNFEYV